VFIFAIKKAQIYNSDGGLELSGTTSNEDLSSVPFLASGIRKRAADAEVKESDNVIVDGENRHWKVVNVTKIIRVKVTKTTKRPKTTTTEELHHIVEKGKPADGSECEY
jgi:hypothetical protein